MTNNYRLVHQFKKTWDWLWNLEERTELKSIKKEFRDTRKLLEEYERLYRNEREKNTLLNWFIQSKLQRPPNVTFVCKHCTFRGKQYHDFCPGCAKDDSGKTSADYFNSQK